MPKPLSLILNPYLHPHVDEEPPGEDAGCENNERLDQEVHSGVEVQAVAVTGDRRTPVALQQWFTFY